MAALREYRMLHMRGAGMGISPNAMVLPERLKSLPVLCLGEWAGGTAVLVASSLRGQKACLRMGTPFFPTPHQPSRS